MLQSIYSPMEDFKMIKLKKGFTLVEILIAMALVAILVAIMSPNIARVRPDQKKALFIKAYTRTEIAVVNMINDTEMYPTVYNEDGTLSQFGLCSTKAPIGLLANTDSASGNTKFVHYFARELGSTESGNTVKTSDGLTYDVNFQNADATNADVTAATITITYKDESIGSIKVKNGGNVECSDDKCTKYIEDRYNLKVDE